jgi:1,4-dihydroxy-2-naphthoyl-CoA synthase
MAISNISKPDIVAVNAYCIGGGHVIHVLCDQRLSCQGGG